ncbi:MAG: hypothetical protein WC498_00360 [Candidatus Saccharimonadales bacterium]
MEEYEEKASEQTTDSLEGDTTSTPTSGVIAPVTAGSESLESLESPASSDSSSESVTPTPKPPHSGLLKRLFSKFNIYLLLFILVLSVATAVIVVAFLLNKRDNTTQVKTQSLSQDALKQLANSDVTVGAPKQILNVQSNAVFAGKVLVNGGLEVVGPLQVGGSLSLPGISVSGNSIFDQVQVKTLNVANDSSFQGQLSIQKNLSVVGSGTFGGILSAPQITANTLTLNGNLNLTHHITVGGATPGRNNGGALGAGGTSSVGGSDSAGSININTGSGAVAGCMITVLFTQKFNATPHVLLTPVGSSAGGLAFYVNRDTSSFSICTASPPPSNASFGFDYFVLD